MRWILKQFRLFIDFIVTNFNHVSRPYALTFFWVGVVLLGWLTNMFFRYGNKAFDIALYKLGVIEEEVFTLTDLAISNWLSSVGLAITLIIILIGTVNVYRSLFNSLLRDQRKFFSKNYGAGIVEVQDGLEAMKNMQNEMEFAEKIINTHFNHHSENKKDDHYNQKYINRYQAFRKELIKLIDDKKIEVSEIASSQYNGDLDKLNKKDGYTGISLGVEKENWLNFTIFKYAVPDRPSRIWFGSGAIPNNDKTEKSKILKCYYSENEEIVKDFTERFNYLLSIYEEKQNGKS